MKLNPKSTLIYGLAIELIFIVVTLIAYYYDNRLINDINIWTKPLKFQFSQSILILTFLWLFPLLSEKLKEGWLVRYGVNLMTIAGSFEVFYITLQSARGVASHYNYSTKMEAAAYQIMGVGATLMVLGCFFFGLALYKSASVLGKQGFKLGGAWGMILGAVFTLFTASILASGAGHWIGGIKSDLNGLPFFGWSRTGGDLRVSHFFATHLMQALPLTGLIADKLVPTKTKAVIVMGSIFGLAIVVATLLQAFSGKPFYGF